MAASTSTETDRSSPRRLNIGCGDRPAAGWINYDNSLTVLLSRIPYLPNLLGGVGLLSPAQLRFIAVARASGIRYADVVRQIPHPAASVDLIYTCHMLEHLTRAEAARFLQECRRVLAPGGAIRIVVPDLRLLVDKYQASQNADRFVESLYMAPTEPESLIFRLKCLIVGGRLHLWMYDSHSLVNLLVSAGFANPTVLPPGRTTITGLVNIDLAERSEESLYIEAVRS